MTLALLRAVMRRQRGVSYFELSAVVVVIAIVSGGAWAYSSRSSETERDDNAVRTASHIRQAVQSWRSENETGCPTLSQLKHEKFLDSDARTDDPWGQRFRLQCSKSDITVVSPGRDGRLDTADDI